MSRVSKRRVLFLLVVVATAFAGTASFDSVAAEGRQRVYVCGGKTLTLAEFAASRNLTVEAVETLHQRAGMTPAEVCGASTEKLRRTLEKLRQPRPDQPDEAMKFRMLSLQDENGVVAPDGLLRARRQVDRMRAEQGPPEQPTAGVQRGMWTWLGPGNIGGRVRSIVISPIDPTKMWIGSVSGGIWKTTNAGVNWSPVDDFMANLAVTTLAMDPLTPNTMYAGTGEGFFNVDAIRGAGIFKSVDGGTTWSQLANTNNSNFYYVNRIAISPNAGTILAATNVGIYRSVDGGANWTQQYAGRTLDVDFHPTDSLKAVAGRDNGQALYSVDGGVTFAAATGLPAGARVEVAYAPSSPSTVYASLNVNSGEIWRSTDGGASYTIRNTGNSYLSNQGWYDNIIWVAPTDPNLVVVGGVDLWRSVDGGSTLTKISQWFSAPLSAHADHHFIRAHPGYDGTTNKTVFFGNDGGVYRADDITTVSLTSGWTELLNNLGNTQFYGAGGNTTSGKIIGGAQDNGTLLYTPAGGTEGWTTEFGGDGGWSAADQSSVNYLYGEYVYLDVHRSADGGASSEYISGKYWNGSAYVWKLAPYLITDVQSAHANFIAPFILDPNNQQRLLAGGWSLWRTNDARTVTSTVVGPTWAAIKAPNAANSPISAIAVAPGNENIVWVGHDNGDVFMTTNGAAATPTWTQMDNNATALPGRQVTRITIDPTNSNRVYVTFGGFSPDNVYLTTNAGASWADRTGSGGTGLPDVPVRSLAIHPDNANWLYVGTEVGIFTSEDGGATWHLPQDGPANVSVDEVFFMDRVLVAATHGRGVYKAPTSASAQLVSVGFASNVSSPSEAAGSVSANVVLTTSDGLPTAGVVTVNYATANGTAAQPGDYGLASGTLTFPGGSVSGTTQAINVTLVNDTCNEPTENFTISLSGVTGTGASIGASLHTVWIADDDPLPSITVGNASIAEGNSGTTTMTFNANLSSAACQTITANFATADGTATSSQANNPTSNATAITINDFAAATPYPSTITVPSLPGIVSKVTVTITGFSHTYPEDVDVLLVGPLGQKVMLMSDTAGVGPGVTNVNLTFDDSGPALIGTATSGTYRPTNLDDSGAGGGNDIFPGPAPAGPYGSALSAFAGLNPAGAWSLYVRDDVGGDSGSISGGWTLNVYTASGDYVATSGTVSFGIGESTKPINVTVFGDVTVEPNETLFLNLSSPTNATLATTQATGTIVNDDGLVVGVDDDMSGDLKSDVVWRNKVDGNNYGWIMNGNLISSQAGLGAVGTTWKIVGRGQFDAGGKADLVWYNSVSGVAYLWRMDGTTVVAQEYIGTVADTNWEIVGSSDYDGDTKADLLWRNKTTGVVYLWRMNGSTVLAQEYVGTVGDTNWEIVGTSDHDGNGKADILWRHKLSGVVYLWRMNGSTVVAQEYVDTLADTNWEVAGTGDHDGNGRADILWRNKVTGVVYLYRMNGASIVASEYVGTIADTNWEVMGSGDYDGGGKADILWRNKSNGVVYLWRMNGASVVAQEYVSTVGDTNWEIANPR